MTRRAPDPAAVGAEVVDALARRLGRSAADDWEIYWELGNERALERREGKLDAIETARASGGLALRVLRRGRLGFAVSTDASPAGQGALVEAALGAARLADRDPMGGFTTPAEVGVLPAVPPADRALARTSEAERASWAAAAEAAARRAGGRLVRVNRTGVSDAETWTHLRTRAGVALASHQTIVSTDVQLVAERGAEAQVGYAWAFSFDAAGLAPARVGRRAAERATMLLGAGSVRTGRHDVLLDAEVVAGLLDALAPALTAESVRKGKSLVGRVGATVGAPGVTLADDATNVRGAGVRAFDGEGVASRRTVLVEGGVLRGLLYDRREAELARQSGEAGARSTGSCERSGPRSLPVLAAGALVLEAGRTSRRALERSLWSGLVVTELLGLHTIDPARGQFSLGASGFRVTRGERAGGVAGFAIAGDFLSLLGAVREVGSDLVHHGTVGAPSLLVEGVEVAGR